MNLLSVLSLIGTITGILGGICVASNAGLFIYGYMFFIVSLVLWVVYGLKTKQKGLINLNLVFSFINVYGLINFI
jgi:hypothetical protein